MSPADTAAQPHARPHGGYAWYVLAVLVVVYMGSFVDRMVLSLLFDPIQRDLRITDTQISLIAGFAFAIFFTTLGLPIGRLADRYSRRLIIIIGSIVWSLATCACGFANTFVHLFLARILVGVGEATLTPSAFSLLADYFPPDRLGRAISLYFTGNTIGAGLAFVLGGAIVHYASSASDVVLPVLGELRPWQLIFIYVGLPGLLLPLLMLTVREPMRLSQGRLERSDEGSIPVREVIAFMMTRRRFFGAHFLGVAVLSMFANGLVVWTPTLFMRIHGWTAQDIGFAFGLVLALAGTLGAFTSGALADRWTRRGHADSIMRVMQYAALLFTPVWIVTPLLSGTRFGIPLLALSTFGAWASFSVAPAALQLVTPSALRAQVSATYLLFVTGLGLGLGPTVIAAMTDYVFADPRALPCSMAILGGMAGFLGVIILRPGRAAFVAWRLDAGAART